MRMPRATRRVAWLLGALLLWAAPLQAQPPAQTILNATLAGAVTADVTAGVFALPRTESLTLDAVITVAGGGTTAKAWVQTSFDGGTCWADFAYFEFTTSTARRIYHLTAAAVTSIATPTDGTLADNTAVNGLLGSVVRVKLTTTGTYTGASSFVIRALAK
jgi:hypothetical protein